MSEHKNTGRAEAAIALHDRGFNCAQSVACAFADKTNLEKEILFRITEGLGLGMGSMTGTCGALSAAALLCGLKCSTAHLDHPDSKAVTYQLSRSCMRAFEEKNGSVICQELKGVRTGKVLRPCPDCIRDAVEIIETLVFPESSPEDTK